MHRMIFETMKVSMLSVLRPLLVATLRVGRTVKCPLRPYMILKEPEEIFQNHIGSRE